MNSTNESQRLDDVGPLTARLIACAEDVGAFVFPSVDFDHAARVDWPASGCTLDEIETFIRRFHPPIIYLVEVMLTLVEVDRHRRRLDTAADKLKAVVDEDGEFVDAAAVRALRGRIDDVRTQIEYSSRYVGSVRQLRVVVGVGGVLHAATWDTCWAEAAEAGLEDLEDDLYEFDQIVGNRANIADEKQWEKNEREQQAARQRREELLRGLEATLPSRLAHDLAFQQIGAVDERWRYAMSVIGQEHSQLGELSQLERGRLRPLAAAANTLVRTKIVPERVAAARERLAELADQLRARPNWAASTAKEYRRRAARSLLISIDPLLVPDLLDELVAAATDATPAGGSSAR